MEAVKKKKKVILQGGICFALVVLIWSGYFVVNKKVQIKRDISNIVEDDYTFSFQIDTVTTEKNKIILDGWAFLLDEEAKENDVEVHLLDLEKNEIVYSDLVDKKRTDVNDYFLCEYDYTNSGFEACFDTSKRDLQDKVYAVLVAFQVKRQIYLTGTYIYNSEIYYVNPKEYEMPVIKDVQLNQIVQDGILRVYRPEEGMYVYQYGGELYWIADKHFGFESDGSTWIQFQLNTTQDMNLPIESNLGYIFEQHEMNVQDDLRVAKCVIPKEYSVTNMWTGYYVEEWIWRQDFRPFYDFK